MKRTRSGFRAGRSLDSPEGEQGFWPSFADMMSSFALILFFLMLISYLQNLITGNNLVSTQELLEETQLSLTATQQQVEDANATLQGLNIQLEDAQAALLEQQENMAIYAATIQGQTATIEEQTAQIQSQEETISEQQAYIALTTEELITLRGQMQTIALLRLSILEKISDSIGNSLGDTATVSISDNGSIILSENLLFDYNSSKIKSGSYTMLNELTNAFADFLSDPENAKYVDSIVISGHTDNTGVASKNRTLSTERANAVLTYLLEQNNGKLSAYSSYFCAAGYGDTRPVGDNDTEEGRSQNRRIEISIILKDETVLELVEAYLKEEAPTAVEEGTLTTTAGTTAGN